MEEGAKVLLTGGAIAGGLAVLLAAVIFYFVRNRA